MGATIRPMRESAQRASDVESSAQTLALVQPSPIGLPLSVAEVLALQRTAGNVATTRVLQRDLDATAPPSPPAAPAPAVRAPSSVEATLLAARAVLNQTEPADRHTRQQVARGL